jgi:Phytanoyl-CoA dioxygenase (PhyH)
VKIRSAIDTYRYWSRQAEARAANGRRVDPVELQSKLDKLRPEIRQLQDQLKSSGVVAIPGYWSDDECADGRSEIDRLLVEYPDVVQRNSGGSDKRMFGVEAVSERLARFHDDALLLAVGERLGGFALYNFATLGARIDATSANNGSGDGWHRDAHDFQFKAILYLSDVSEPNGPFEYLPGSQLKWRAVFDTAIGNLPPAPSSRYEPALIDKMLTRSPFKIERYLGKAGTLLLVNTSGIHRGRPLRAGSRYALTNYYYDPYQIDRNRVLNFPTLMPGAGERIIGDLELA